MPFRKFVSYRISRSAMLVLGIISSTASATCQKRQSEGCAYVVECTKESVICIINVDYRANLGALSHSEAIEDQEAQIESLVDQGFVVRQVIIDSKASRYIEGIEHVAQPFTLVMSVSRKIAFLHHGIMADDLTRFAKYIRDGGERPGGEPFIQLIGANLHTDQCGMKL